MKADRVEFAPLSVAPDFDIAFDADDEVDLPFSEQSEQIVIREAAIRRQPQASGFDASKDQLESPLDDGQFITFHSAFEHALRVSLPKDRQRASPDDQRNDEQMLIVFGGPINGQADFARRRDLRGEHL